MKRVIWLSVLPAVFILLALNVSAEATANAKPGYAIGNHAIGKLQGFSGFEDGEVVKVIVKLNVSMHNVKEQKLLVSTKAKGKAKAQGGKIKFVDDAEFAGRKSEIVRAATQSKSAKGASQDELAKHKGRNLQVLKSNNMEGSEQSSLADYFRKFLPAVAHPNEQVLELAKSLSKKNIASTAHNNLNIKELKIIGSIAMEVPVEKLEDLAASSAVIKISPVRKYSILLSESVPYINATGAWATLSANGTNITGAGTKIAIVDTGVDYTHPDLGGCTSLEVLGSTCSKVIGGYDFVNYDFDPMDDHGHGTHVAATAAGSGALLGVAPDAKILAYKVLDSDGGGYEVDIIASIEKAVADGANVISMSLGGVICYPPSSLEDAVSAAVDVGVVVVIAAGNDGPGERSVVSPGCAPKALTVAAACSPSTINVSGYCPNTNIATFSSRGPAVTRQKPDVAAPGVDICAARFGSYGSSTCIDSAHIKISGTSMATPHVSGAVALILQNHPDWSPDQVKAALKYTATPLGTNRLAEGAGLINVGAAVALATAPPVAILEEVSNLAIE